MSEVPVPAPMPHRHRCCRPRARPGRGAGQPAPRGARSGLRGGPCRSPAHARQPAVARVVPPRRLRLDAELVRRGLAPSRERAAQLIADGRVKVSGALASKAATGVTTDVAIVVLEGRERPRLRLAGRAQAGRRPRGLRPARASTVEGRRCLDAGASTGGFTDVLLRAGAAEVVAVDVGLRAAPLVACSRTSECTSTTAPTSARSTPTRSAARSRSSSATCPSSR